MHGVSIRLLEPKDIEGVARLRRNLFGDCPLDQQIGELRAYYKNDTKGVGAGACFVAAAEDEHIGFAEVFIRSHAEGAWELTAQGRLGVGYLESLWVAPEQRRQGVGTALVQSCEDWTRYQGFTAMASDSLLDNKLGQSVHEKLGFQEVERSVHFIKRLD